IAAAPQAGHDALFGIGEHGRAIDDARAARIVHRHLDHVDAEQRGALVAGDVADAAGELFLVTHRRRAGDVHDDLAVLVRPRNDRVRVRAAAGLHGTHLHGAGEVADVEDAQSAEALFAHVPGDALEAAVEPAA